MDDDNGTQEPVEPLMSVDPFIPANEALAECERVGMPLSNLPDPLVRCPRSGELVRVRKMHVGAVLRRVGSGDLNGRFAEPVRIPGRLHKRIMDAIRLSDNVPQQQARELRAVVATWIVGEAAFRSEIRDDGEFSDYADDVLSDAQPSPGGPRVPACATGECIPVRLRKNRIDSIA